MTFQKLLLELQRFWEGQGCVLLQPLDIEVGAGTMHPGTALRVLGPEPWRTAYVQPSRRPNDGRYAENPNRLQHYYQFQVILKPPPNDVQEIYLSSLEHLGIRLTEHDIRFVEDDWEAPTLGASGVGWEVWLDGMEITQFTYFQQMGGIELDPVSVEITYGPERLALFLTGAPDVFALPWAEGITYGEIHRRSEYEACLYNFDKADVSTLFTLFDLYEQEADRILGEGLIVPGFEATLKCSHIFNLLDSRGVLSVMERTRYIKRVQELARRACQGYLRQREEMGFPLLKGTATVSAPQRASDCPS
ncbi:MAG: glycine--tRNA ligase subunit alpha [Armatimonadetes bacterium]|nr:glycine--tRNA ligase subunit alpha [Armatimonadota bacterium]MDW8120838.1 glycine--tRNA ligase subunit alpha [Armatimonadota bacterium]